MHWLCRLIGLPRVAAGAPPDGGITWRLHAEVVLLLGWGRAILMQLAHPLVAAGVAHYSRFHTQPGGRRRRLHRTLEAMLALTFGTPEDGARAIQGINAIHDRVHGRLPAPAGAFPPGTPYSARDPALLAWVHATLVDSSLRAYELYVGPLSPAEQDRYCAEASRIEASLGLPEGSLPRSVAGLRRYLEEKLASGEIAVTESARDLAREVLSPPLPGVARPLLWLAQLPTVGLLPPALREGYGLPWNARREAALRLSAWLVRRLLRFAPSRLRYWSPARAAFRRACS